MADHLYKTANREGFMRKLLRRQDEHTVPEYTKAEEVRAKRILSRQRMPRSKLKPCLGIEVQDVDPGLVGAFGLPRAAGALGISVEPGTPAAASGLKPGDVIVQIGDKTIDRSAELVEDAADLRTGTKITLKLIRNRKPMTMSVMAGASGETPGARQNEDGAADRLGLIIHPLSEDERRANGLAEGLMVDGAATSAGIQLGDIVLSLNGTLVSSQEEMAALAAKAGKKVAMLIQRDHARSFISVQLR